jgi:transposase
MQDDVTRLVGIDGLQVIAVAEALHALVLDVELTARAGCCGWCGRSSLKVKERPVVTVRDLPIVGRATFLRWRKRRYGCEACGRTFTESHPQLPPRQRVSARFRTRLFERVRGGAAHAEVARDEHTTRYQVTRAFCAGAEELEAGRGLRAPRRLSLDEAQRGPNQPLATVISDLDARRVIELLDGRSRRIVERWLRALPDEYRRTVEVVAIDPYEAYRQAIQAQLPHATIVVDPFHMVRGANTALDYVRRSRQRQARVGNHPKGARRGGALTWRRDLYNARRRLLKARERLTAKERQQLCRLFEREPLVADAWALKEAFRDVYRASYREDAAQRLDAFLAAVERAGLPSFTSFAAGVRLWRDELLNYYIEPATNGYAEGVINKIQVTKRRAYGMPTFHGFRKRVLIVCG